MSISQDMSMKIPSTAQPTVTDQVPQLGQARVRNGQDMPGHNEEEAEDFRITLGSSDEADPPVYDRNGEVSGKKEVSGKAEEQTTSSNGTRGPKGETLTSEEAAKIRDLKAVDQEVRAHEMAHVAAGGNLVRGGANFGYKKGPDGRSYAVSGEVSIDTSAEKEPEDTVRKMERVQAAAMAPAEPSSQDRAVAAAAAQKAVNARMEIAQQTESDAAPSPDMTGKKKETQETGQILNGYKKSSPSGNKSEPFHLII